MNPEGSRQWPGSGVAKIGYGTVGGLIWDDRKAPIYSRQHGIGGFVNGGTTSLTEPIRPRHAFNGYYSNRVDSLQAFVGTLDLGGVDTSFLKGHGLESSTIESPSAYDPQMGRRISAIDLNPIVLAYGDDQYVNIMEDESISVTIDMCSPVLQVETENLVRTKRGVATINRTIGSVNYFSEDSFMHVASAGPTEALTTTVDGKAMLHDLEYGSTKWVQQVPRGTIGGWSKILSLENPSLALWCNRYEMAVLDLRQKPSSGQTAKHVLKFQDRTAQIFDVDAGSERSSDIFVLTSYELLWISDGVHRQTYQPVLSLEQPISASDQTMNLYKGSFKGSHLVTVASQLMPITLATMFGRTVEDGLPVTLEDTYYMDSWPTIISQSHLTVQSGDDVKVYTVGLEGGLYLQRWNETDPGEILDNTIDVPLADPPAETDPVVRMSKYDLSRHKDFDLLDHWTSSDIFNFERLYDILYSPLAPMKDQDHEMNKSMSHIGFEDVADLKRYCQRVWLDPLKQKAEERQVSSAALSQRQLCIQRMVSDLAEIPSGMGGQDFKLDLDEGAQRVKDRWAIGSETSQLETGGSNGYTQASSQPDMLTQESAWMSQPTQDVAHSELSSQPFLPTSMSQPVPALGRSRKSKKEKTKKKKKRPRESSRKAHS